jgi:hypothetical protein
MYTRKHTTAAITIHTKHTKTPNTLTYLRELVERGEGRVALSIPTKSSVKFRVDRAEHFQSDMLEQMQADVRTAFANARTVCEALIERGAKLRRIETNARELAETGELYHARSLGVVSQSVAARYCRLCMFDIEFRTVVYLVVLAVALFVILIAVHLAFLD